MKKKSLFLVLIFTIYNLSAQNIFYDDFDYTDIETINNNWDLCKTRNLFFQGNLLDFKSITLSNDQSRLGSQSLKIEFNRIDNSLFSTFNNTEYESFYKNGFKRCELSTQKKLNCTDNYNPNFIIGNDPDSKYHDGDEIWYAYSMYIPSNGWDFDDSVSSETNEMENSEIVGQFHATSHSGIPPLSLRILNDQFTVVKMKDDSRELQDNGLSAVDIENRTQILHSSTVIRDQWIDWVFHIKWSSTNTESSILEIWKNGNRVVNEIGMRNVWLGIDGINMQLGVYKPFWWRYPTAVQSRTIYFDEVKIGEGKVFETPTPYPISLLDKYCDTTIDINNLKLEADYIEGANYLFRFTDISTNEVEWVNSNSNTIYLSDFEWIKPNTTYNIRVRIPDHQIHYTYDIPCQITTPSMGEIKLENNYCNTTIGSSRQKISAENVTDSHQYHFRFYDIETKDVFYRTSKDNSIYLSEVKGLQANSTYNVNIRLINHPLYNYSQTPCSITTPEILAIGLIDEFCHQITNDNKIIAEEVIGESNYRFRLYNTENGHTLWRDSPNNILFFSDIDGFQYNTLYNVKVRIPSHELYFNYSQDPCQILASSISGKQIPNNTKIDKFDNNQSNNLLYPNPVKNGELLKIKISESSSIKILNINGDVLLDRKYNDTNEISIRTEKFSKGIYFIKIFNASRLIIKKIIVN